MPAAVTPPAFDAWYRSNYPTLVFNPEWLGACVEYLKATDPLCRTATAHLIKQVETQLLSSDLATSVLATSPAIVDHARVFSTIVDAKANVEGTRGTVFNGGRKRSAVLVQVERVEDVSHSASMLLEISRDKREWIKLEAKGIDGGVAAAGGRDMRLDDDHEDDDPAEGGGGGGGRGGGLDREEKKILQGGDGREPRFPRGSSKMLLSDGFNSVTAFELTRIPGLGLEEVKLGTKLLIHDVPFVNGIMLLTPANTTVKGHEVQELDQFKDWTIENSLRERLQMDLLPKPDGFDRSPSPPRVQAVANNERPDDAKPSAPAVAGGPSSRLQPRPDDRGRPQNPPRLDHQDDDDDEDAFLIDGDDEIDFDKIQAEAIAKSQLSQRQHQRLNPQQRPPPNHYQQQQQPPRQLSQRPSASANAKGKGKAKEEARHEADVGDDLDVITDIKQGGGGAAEREEEEDDEESWNVMNEMEEQQQRQTRGPRRDAAADAGASVEVLELDSDYGDDDSSVARRERSRPIIKRAKVAHGGGGGGTSSSAAVPVLELDDSD